MTDAMIITQAYKIEKVTIRCVKFKKGSRVLLCDHAKLRASWNLMKSRADLRQEQNLYVRMIDQAVSSDELEKFLHTQNIQLT